MSSSSSGKRPSGKRRPLDLGALNEHAARRKLAAAIEIPASKRKSVSVSKESLIPVIQADIGSETPVSVYRYRMLVPVQQVLQYSKGNVRRKIVAAIEDIEINRNTLIRHFGGVTVLHQPPAPAAGVGARDPADVAGTLEENEHIAFEVYAAPLHESDEYFRSLRRMLEESLQEGVILIERQQSTLI